MRVLYIGGTGVISIACTALAAECGIEVSVLNRGKTAADLPPNVMLITADIRSPEQVAAALNGQTFDVVANFIAFTRDDVERDVRLFHGKTSQYIFVSSASAYQKPLPHYRVTETTPLGNPFWQYARDKIACETYLMDAHRSRGFPVTIVRPSLTYGDTLIPLSINAKGKPWSVVDRMLRDKPILVHGDGLGLWTTTHNTDFAEGFLGLHCNDRAVGEAFHITSDEVITWDEHYQTVASILGVTPRLVHVSSEMIADRDEQRRGSLLGDKAHSAVFDNSKIKSIVPGLAAKTFFRQGMERTIEHFRRTPSLQIVDEEFDRWCDALIEDVAPPSRA